MVHWDSTAAAGDIGCCLASAAWYLVFNLWEILAPESNLQLTEVDGAVMRCCTQMPFLLSGFAVLPRQRHAFESLSIIIVPCCMRSSSLTHIVTL